jgi:hypothetical protein
MAIAELPQEVDLFHDNEEPVEYNVNCTWEAWEENMIRYDPTERCFGKFFFYATCHWLQHFGAVKLIPLPPPTRIENLCQVASTTLLSRIQHNCRSDCTITPISEFDGSLYDPLNSSRGNSILDLYVDGLNSLASQPFGIKVAVVTAILA